MDVQKIQNFAAIYNVPYYNSQAYRDKEHAGQMPKTLRTVAARVIIIVYLFNVDFEDRSGMWTNAYALNINHYPANVEKWVSS
jgi:hypothetical protein